MLFMRERLQLGRYKLGVSGDRKAARLFLETFTDKRSHTLIQNKQNNYIQIKTKPGCHKTAFTGSIKTIW